MKRNILIFIIIVLSFLLGMLFTITNIKVNKIVSNSKEVNGIVELNILGIEYKYYVE